MGKFTDALALGAALALTLALKPPAAYAQGSYPVVDKLAEKVVAHYQNASCEQIAAQKAQAPAPEQEQMKQRAVQMLRNDPGMRTYFINKVAAPIANKLFECGMIP